MTVKRIGYLSLRLTLLIIITIGLIVSATGPQYSIAQSATNCIDCHRKNSPALVMEWERSLHSKNDVGCAECHGANKGEQDAWLHEGT